MHTLESITKKFEFSDGGKELLLIALKTGFLTLITLGIYRFWAKTKIRNFIWASASLDGDSFEYHGTGLEQISWLSPRYCDFGTLPWSYSSGLDLSWAEHVHRAQDTGAIFCTNGRALHKYLCGLSDDRVCHLSRAALSHAQDLLAGYSMWYGRWGLGLCLALNDV